ncbi:MAG: hypothetical protein IJQ80_05490, partial [Clostridia bacterium]|nr:hypothetical protein [Clostridia bacterium]
MKKTRKALLSLILTAAMLISAFPIGGAVTVAASNGATYKYVLVDTLTQGNTYLIANGASGSVT